MNLILYAILQLRLFLRESKESKRKYGNNYSEEDYLFLADDEIVFDIPANAIIPQIKPL
jgi:hypothetical protein